MTIMLILCVKRYLDSFVDELGDWKDEGAQIFLYGITNKASHGFIFLEWAKPIPELFHHKLRSDIDVIDYAVIGKDIPTIPIPAQP